MFDFTACWNDDTNTQHTFDMMKKRMNTKVEQREADEKRNIGEHRFVIYSLTRSFFFLFYNYQLKFIHITHYYCYYCRENLRTQTQKWEKKNAFWTMMCSGGRFSFYRSLSLSHSLSHWLCLCGMRNAEHRKLLILEMSSLVRPSRVEFGLSNKEKHQNGRNVKKQKSGQF